MAVVIVNEMESGNQETYDKVTPKVMEGGNLPDGCELHIAGPSKSGWRIISVWDSEERFQQFRDEKLIPALREAGGEDLIAPSVSAEPVHKLISA